MKTQAIDAIQKIEKNAFNEGFKAGWFAASQHMIEALKKPVIPAYQAGDESPKEPSSGNPFRPNTESSAVYEYIKTHPGKRGSEIIAILDISAKSARNAFHRLKKRGVALNEDGWRLTGR